MLKTKGIATCTYLMKKIKSLLESSVTYLNCSSCVSLIFWTLFFLFRGLVPLHNACSYGHFEVTEMLLKVQYGLYTYILFKKAQIKNNKY